MTSTNLRFIISGTLLYALSSVYAFSSQESPGLPIQAFEGRYYIENCRNPLDFMFKAVKDAELVVTSENHLRMRSITPADYDDGLLLHSFYEVNTGEENVENYRLGDGCWDWACLSYTNYRWVRKAETDFNSIRGRIKKQMQVTFIIDTPFYKTLDEYEYSLTLDPVNAKNLHWARKILGVNVPIETCDFVRQ